MNGRSSGAGRADVAEQTISERVQKLIALDKLFSLFGIEVEEASETTPGSRRWWARSSCSCMI